MSNQYKIMLNNEELKEINKYNKMIMDILKTKIDFENKDYVFMYWNSGVSPVLSLFKSAKPTWERVALPFDIRLLKICSKIYKIANQGRVFALSIYIDRGLGYELRMYDDLNPISDWTNIYIIAYKEYGIKLPILDYAMTDLDRLLKLEDFKDSLFYAVYHRNLARVEDLIVSSSFEDINKYIKTLGTPLYVACKNGDMEIVKLLVKHGAKINQEDYVGKSALMESIEKGHENIARFLIDNGADINTKSLEGDNPLELAIINDLSIEFISYLIEKGSDIRSFDFDKMDLLSIAVHKKNFKLIDVLISNGIDKKYIKKALEAAKREKEEYEKMVEFLSILLK